jgi:16S rRNA processing protein RimM
MYLIGKITTTHGIRGEVKILNLSDYPRFNVGDKVYINDTPYEIESSRPHKGQLIIKLSHVNTMNDGLLLKDQDVYAKERIEDDDYHYEDIIGCEVKTLEAVSRGWVSSLVFCRSASVRCAGERRQEGCAGLASARCLRLTAWCLAPRAGPRKVEMARVNLSRVRVW